VGNSNDLFLSVISSGGSQAVFFKINTFGESAFTDKIAKIVERWERGNETGSCINANAGW